MMKDTQLAPRSCSERRPSRYLDPPNVPTLPLLRGLVFMALCLPCSPRGVLEIRNEKCLAFLVSLAVLVSLALGLPFSPLVSALLPSDTTASPAAPREG